MEIVDLIIGGSTVDNRIMLYMLQSHERFNPSPNVIYSSYMLIGAIVTSFKSGAIFQSIGAQCADLDFLQSPDDDEDHVPILVLSYQTTSPKFEVISLAVGDEEKVNSRLKTYLWHKFKLNTILKLRSIIISGDNNLGNTISFNVSDTLYITQEFRREFVLVFSQTNCRQENINALGVSYAFCNMVFENDEFNILELVDCLRKYLTTIARSFLKLIKQDDKLSLLTFSFENLEAYITGAISMGNYRLMNLSRDDQRLPRNVNLNFI